MPLALFILVHLNFWDQVGGDVKRRFFSHFGHLFLFARAYLRLAMWVLFFLGAVFWVFTFARQDTLDFFGARRT